MGKPIFEIEISNSSPKGYETATVMEMPATWAEFNDALQKARIKDGRSCKNELTHIRCKGLHRGMIGENVNLYDLNLFAQRLAMLTEDQQLKMEALLKMEQKQHSEPVPLERLINLTYNTDVCCFAPQVSNHMELGEFLYKNEMLLDEARALLDITEEGNIVFWERLLELLGEQHQEDHSGVFTDCGYAELGGEIKPVYVYRPGEVAYFHRSGAPVVLEVRKGFFNDPQYDNENTAALDLPVIHGGIQQALEAVDAVSTKECAFHCADCLIPSLRDAINDALEDDDLEQVNDFAKELSQKERVWGEAEFVRYKALLAAVGQPDLTVAAQLIKEADQYELRPDVAQTWDYAELVLREKYPDLPEELFQTPQAALIGQRMLDDQLGAITDYGLIRRVDGQPLPVFQPEYQKEAFSVPQMEGM